jgi:hypothetical protein
LKGLFSDDIPKEFRAMTAKAVVGAVVVLLGMHIPLNKWMHAMHLMYSSKKGISAHQLHRTLEVTYKTGVRLPVEPAEDERLRAAGGSGRRNRGHQAVLPGSGQHADMKTGATLIGWCDRRRRRRESRSN